MKKILGTFLVLTFFLIGYLSLQSIKDKTNTIDSIVKQASDDTNFTLKKAFKNTPKYPTKEIEQLSTIAAHCKNKNINFSAQVKKIHLGLTNAFELALKKGISPRDLLAYSNQYETYYQSYDDLLIQAQVNIEKNKYDIAPSISILNDWKGLSILKGFSAETIATLVEKLSGNENDSFQFTLPISLNEKANKQNIDTLLNNGDNFFTYLDSPFSIADNKVISPSILFILSAKILSLDEFESAINGLSFTVNDIAVAIKSELPIAYLSLLIAATKDIGDMPIFVQTSYDHYYNLADLAVSTYNVEVLELLKTKGINPTNEAGIITGMDIAIMNLPNKAKDYKNVEQFSNKYIKTLNYLKEKNYKAHGKNYFDVDSQSIIFQAPNSRRFDSNKALDPNLKKLLLQIELISSTSNIQQRKPDDSIMSKAIKKIQIEKENLNSSFKSCATIEDELLAAQEFSSQKAAYKKINKLKKNGRDIKSQLHYIDPALLHIWYSIENFNNNETPYQRESKFLTLINNALYLEALNYSNSTPLSQYETDELLRAVINNPQTLTTIWNVRVAPKPVKNIRYFSMLPMKKWLALADENFDFSLKDVWGNDLFIPAILHSKEAINFLMDKSYTTDVKKMGLDVLDVMLEESYKQGALSENVFIAIGLVKEIEPNHFARIARLKKYYPKVYDELIKAAPQLAPPENTEMNHYTFNR